MKRILIFIALIVSLIFPASNFASSDWWDVTDETFEIQVGDFTPGGTQFLEDTDDGTAWVVNNVLLTVMEKLIVIFGVLASFIMTIWAGYMIIYHGEESLLSRWKSIFIAWVLALVIALSAGVIMQVFTYILY